MQHRVRVESPGNEPLEAGVHGNRIQNRATCGSSPSGMGSTISVLAGFILTSTRASCNGFTRRTLIGLPSLRSVRSLQRSDPRGLTVLLAPPYASRLRGDGTPQATIIGVGESIGTVSPFTGEGIVYSLECARLLAGSWPDEKLYASEVLARFRWMKKEKRDTLDYLISEGRAGGPRLRDRWRFFRNARRSGIGLPLVEAFRRIGSTLTMGGKPVTGGPGAPAATPPVLVSP